MSQKSSSVPTNNPGVFNYEEKRPSSEPKTGVARTESKTPLFGNPAASQLARGFTSLGHPRFVLSKKLFCSLQYIKKRNYFQKNQKYVVKLNCLAGQCLRNDFL
jgi:hypothetical protein